MTRRRAPASRQPSASSERGFALILALVVLVVLGLVAAVLMSSVTLNTQGTGHGVRHLDALNIAEAGVAEAIARLEAGDVPDTLNTRMVTQIFNAAAGSVPALGTDSTGLATAQAAGTWLAYSTTTRGSDALTVTYKTDAARTKIYRYDSEASPAVNFDTGKPIFVISSVGRVGTARSHVVTEVTRGEGGSIALEGALMANVPIEASGGSAACGYNHSIGMPAGADCTLYHTGSGDITGGWGTNDVYETGGGSYMGVPPAEEYQTGFPAGPWEILGMTNAEFFTWVGPRRSTIPAVPIVGPVYLDNDLVRGNKSANFSFTGSYYGSGFLYVDGAFKMLAGARWTGLIYTEGNCELAAGSFTKGAVVCNGTTLARTSGSGTLVFCEEALNGIVAGGGEIITLSWREVDQ